MRIYGLDYTSSSDSISVKLQHTIKPHTAPIVVTTIDATGTLLATGASSGDVKVWDIKAGHTTHTLHGHGSVISSLIFFTSKGTTKGQVAGSYRLAAGSEDGKIRVWSLENRRRIALLDSHVSVVRSLDYQSVSNTFLSASRDRTVMLWDCASWQTKVTIPVLESVESAGFLNNYMLYTGGENGQLRMWQTSTGQSVTPLGEADTASIIQTINYENLPFLLTVHADQVLQLHNKGVQGASGAHSAGLPVSRQISGTHDEVIDLDYVGQSKKLLAVATNVEDIRLLHIDTTESSERGNKPSNGQYFGSDVAVLKGHEDIIICLDVDWSGSWLVSGAKDNTAKLWRIDAEKRSFTCFTTLTGHAESIGAISLPRTPPPADSAAFQAPLDHPPPFVITGSQDKTIKKWEIKPPQKNNGQAARALYTRKAHDKDINAIDLNQSSSLFASASQDRTVKIWSAEEGETVGVLRGHRRGVWSVKFAPHGTPAITAEGGQASTSRGFVLTGSGDKTVKIWSLADYSCLRTFEGHTNSVLKVVWLHLPTSGSDKQSNGDDAPQPRQSEKRGLQIASAGGDGLVKIWDVKSGELATTLDNHTDRVWALAVHPKTNALISGGGDSVITFWKDATSSNVALAAAASTARVEQDQELQNYIRAGSYREAITLALQLDHPARLLSLFTSVVNTYPREKNSLSGVAAVDQVLASLSDDQLLALLARVRDWNANAKTAPVAQRVLWTLLRSYPPNRLLRLQSRKKPGMKEMLDAIRAYTERHYTRMEELIDESYLVDYTLQEMDSLGFESSAPNGIRVNGA